jgi:hypothetical protein
MKLYLGYNQIGAEGAQNLTQLKQAKKSLDIQYDNKSPMFLERCIIS